MSRSIFISQRIFDENLVAIHEIKPVLTLNKPNYAGFSILDLSKLLMYDLHFRLVYSFSEKKLKKHGMWKRIFLNEQNF